jgi:hypothetical protein
MRKTYQDALQTSCRSRASGRIEAEFVTLLRFPQGAVKAHSTMRVSAFSLVLLPLVLLPLFAPAGATLKPRASSTPVSCYICYFEDNLGDDIVSTTRDLGTETLSCVYQFETCKYSLVSTVTMCPQQA